MRSRYRARQSGSNRCKAERECVCVCGVVVASDAQKMNNKKQQHLQQFAVKYRKLHAMLIDCMCVDTHHTLARRCVVDVAQRVSGRPQQGSKVEQAMRA
jgi:hypothetical protein